MKLLRTPAKALAIGTVSLLVMFRAIGDVPASPPSGDVQMGQVVAGYTRSTLDRGGWDNTVMHNSEYTAANPLLAVRVGSGATSVAG